jgi:hypothetical protein
LFFVSSAELLWNSQGVKKVKEGLYFSRRDHSRKVERGGFAVYKPIVLNKSKLINSSFYALFVCIYLDIMVRALSIL